MTAVPRRRQWQPRARANGLLGTHAICSQQAYYAPVNHARSSPRNPCTYGSLLIYRPLRDGWLSWPCWLTDSGRLNRKVVSLRYYCELDPTVWICVGLAFAWIEARLCDCAVRPSELFHRLLLWPSGRIAVLVTFLLVTG